MCMCMSIIYVYHVYAVACRDQKMAPGQSKRIESCLVLELGAKLGSFLEQHVPLTAKPDGSCNS